MTKSVCIVGTGQAGRAMGRLLARAGFSIRRVVSRSIDRAREAVAFIGSGEPAVEAAFAEMILLAVPDDRILEVAEGLPPVDRSIVAHLSGVHSAEILSGLRRRGARIGALHPLRSFADPARAVDGFAGTYCAVDGDAAGDLEGVVRAIGGIPLVVRSEKKVSYHAGAVFASNYLVSILESAFRLFEEAGIPRPQAAAPLLNLARGTLTNVERVGIPAALTGPIERGDVETVRLHVRALGESAPLYRELARVTCDVARAKGTISQGTAESLLRAATGEGA